MRDRTLIWSAGVVLVLFVFAFLFVAGQLVGHHLAGFDSTVTDWVQSRIDPLDTTVMEVLTDIGSPTAVAVLTLFTASILYLRRKRWEAVGMVITNAAGGAFDELLKWLFHRQRPDIHRLVAAHGYSFPSGHSMGSVVFYGMLTYFICLFAKSRATKVLAVVASAVLVALIGVSRIYLGVHYPSDVVAGFAAGGAWLVACVLVLHIAVQHHTTRLRHTGPRRGV